MGIDFHSKSNSESYTSRSADDTWKNELTKHLPLESIHSALDIACGGGIYSKALADMGIASVTGLDFSEAMLAGARKNCRKYENIFFQSGNAFHTGLAADTYDLVLQRALIHHLQDLRGCFTEAYRVLKNEGFLVVQDRTPEDCLLPGYENHIRGYFFEKFPMLIHKETSRRHSSASVSEALTAAGFEDLHELKLWEIRGVYDDKKQLLDDLRERTGRSILHELEEKELLQLISHIDTSLSENKKIVEKDRWTIWIARKK